MLLLKRVSAALMSGSAASGMLDGEAQGLALDFTDDFFKSTGHYGSARVKDTSTPANNYNSHPFGLLTYAGASPKLCRGPDGNLRYGAHNLVTHSEALTNASWARVGVTVTEDGTKTPHGAPAFLLVGNAETNLKRITQNFSPITGLKYRVEVDVKAAGYNTYSVRFTSSERAVFNLVEGTVSINGTVITAADLEVLGDGWFRCWYEFVATSDTTFIFLGPSTGNSTGNNLDGLYFSRVSLRRTPSDDTYLKTTDSAVYELPYEWDLSGNLLGIVRPEPQKTNYATWSEDVSQWRNSGGVTFGTHEGVPALFETEDEVNHGVQTTAERSDGEVYTRWGVVKPIGRRYVLVSIRGFGGGPNPSGAAGGNWNTFDTQTGTWLSADSKWFAIEDTDGFWVLGATSIGSSSDNDKLGFVALDTNDRVIDFAGDPSKGLAVKRAQYEDGETRTSYIQTAGSTVTRAADVFGPPLADFPWNEGNGVLTINDEEVEPSDDGTILMLDAPNGHTHIQTVKWVPSP